MNTQVNITKKETNDALLREPLKSKRANESPDTDFQFHGKKIPSTKRKSVLKNFNFIRIVVK